MILPPIIFSNMAFSIKITLSQNFKAHNFADRYRISKMLTSKSSWLALVRVIFEICRPVRKPIVGFKIQMQTINCQNRKFLLIVIR
ncbi:hypothetical protein M5D96_007423, partial [Drosophila gunungcola]